VYDALGSISWAGNVKGFSNDEPIYKLATYTTHHWLSDVHEDQMLDLLWTEIKFDATSPPVIWSSSAHSVVHTSSETQIMRQADISNISATLGSHSGTELTSSWLT
jgi:hypothetical protein